MLARALEDRDQSVRTLSEQLTRAAMSSYDGVARFHRACGILRTQLSRAVKVASEEMEALVTLAEAPEPLANVPALVGELQEALSFEAAAARTRAQELAS